MILLNNSIPYVPNDVYMEERTFNGYDSNTFVASNEYTKMDEAVVRAKTEQLYEHFLEVVRVRTNDAEIFETVQDMIQVCTDTFDEIVRNGARLNEKNVFDGFGWLNQERNTWKLLHCLYKDRLLNPCAMDGVDDDDELWLHSSEKEIIDKLYKQNENVREYQLIIDWLEQCESQQHFDKCRHFMDETISWENTLHQLQNVGKTVFGSGKEIVKSLDPDAPIREKKPLHDLDMEDETRISKEVCHIHIVINLNAQFNCVFLADSVRNPSRTFARSGNALRTCRSILAFSCVGRMAAAPRSKLQRDRWINR